MTQPVLAVEDLKAHLHVAGGVVRAVDGVSFALRRGETLCIVASPAAARA